MTDQNIQELRESITITVEHIYGLPKQSPVEVEALGELFGNPHVVNAIFIFKKNGCDMETCINFIYSNLITNDILTALRKVSNYAREHGSPEGPRLGKETDSDHDQ